MKKSAHFSSKQGYQDKKFSRRGFLSAIGAVSAGLVAGACGRMTNPLQSNHTTEHFSSPSPQPPRTLPIAEPKLAKVTVANIDNYIYTDLKREITAMFDGLGGLSDIIKPGDKVALKINLTGGAGYTRNGLTNGYGISPCELYWTHPTVTQVVGELVRDAGAGTIYLMEAFWNSKDYTDFGFKEVVEYLGGIKIDLNLTDPYTEFGQYPVGTNMQLWENFTQNHVLHEIDCLISMAKAKQHDLAGMTHSMKNLVGSVPKKLYDNNQSYRAAIHGNNPGYTLVKAILDLNNCRPVHLGVVDAIKTCLGSEGPWTKIIPASFNTLIASKDPVAADAISSIAIGFDPMAGAQSPTFPKCDNYFYLAQQLGMGIHDVDKIEVQNTTQNTGVAHRGIG